MIEIKTEFQYKIIYNYLFKSYRRRISFIKKFIYTMFYEIVVEIEIY